MSNPSTRRSHWSSSRRGGRLGEIAHFWPAAIFASRFHPDLLDLKDLTQRRASFLSVQWATRCKSECPRVLLPPLCHEQRSFKLCTHLATVFVISLPKRCALVHFQLEMPDKGIDFHALHLSPPWRLVVYHLTRDCLICTRPPVPAQNCPV